MDVSIRVRPRTQVSKSQTNRSLRMSQFSPFGTLSMRNSTDVTLSTADATEWKGPDQHLLKEISRLFKIKPLLTPKAKKQTEPEAPAETPKHIKANFVTLRPAPLSRARTLGRSSTLNISEPSQATFVCDHHKVTSSPSLGCDHVPTRETTKHETRPFDPQKVKIVPTQKHACVKRRIQL